MDPQLKQIFDEIKLVSSSVADVKSTLTTHIDGVEKKLGDRFESLEATAQVLEDWKPKMDASIDDLCLEVGAMRKTVNRVVLDSPTSSSPGIFPKPVAATAATMMGDKVESAEGFSVDNRNRESSFDTVFTHTHTQGKGTFEIPSSQFPKSFSHPKLEIPRFNSEAPTGHLARSPKESSSVQSRLPKLNFPSFDGDNPKLWISRCQDCFELYDVEPNRWIMVATMHFSDAAGRWLQSVEKKLKSISWKEFCSMLLERFGRDQHEVLIRQLFHIRQIGTVKEYIDQFSELVDQLAAYDSRTDPMLFTLRFIDGLRNEIKSNVMLQRPQDLDNACVLAQLQEEVVDPAKKKDARRPDFSSRSSFKNPLPLPVPPRLDKTPSSTPQDRRGLDASRHKSADDKWASIRSFRRAKGLCQYCAEKWSRDHKCAETVQLQALQEVLQVFQSDDDQKSVSSRGSLHQDQLFMFLSVAVVSGVSAPRTMTLRGLIQGKEIAILVDSGSSHTFVSDTLSLSLLGVIPMESDVKVQVADGGLLHCSAFIPKASWSVHGYEFQSNLKVLPLSSYDMILGLDWLEQHSPMKVHWKHKWMQIPIIRSLLCYMVFSLHFLKVL
ncbi:unnamed protein product [Urochloa humidicola]